MYRVEDKYNCTAAELVMLQSRMEAVLRPDVNEGDSEGYRITSLYFDDLEDSCLHDTEAKQIPYQDLQRFIGRN